MIQDFQRHVNLAIFVFVNKHCWTFKCFFEVFKRQRLALQVWRLANFRSGCSDGWSCKLNENIIFRTFLLKPIITPAYYIMAGWPDWTVPYNGELLFISNRAKKWHKFSPSSVQYRKWPPTANDAQNGPQIILDRKWSPNWTANDPKIIGTAWTQVSVKVKFCFSNERYIQDFVQ